MRTHDRLTSTQAAQLAAVAPSTIKRWADQGRLPYIRTAGGHRRFTRADVERFVRDQQVANGTEDPRVATWIRCLVSANRYESDGRLLEARARLGAWYRVAEELAEVLRELGNQWETGQISIAQEHTASTCLARSLSRVGDALLTREDGPRCVLACTGDEEHTLGLALAELCLRERGWTTHWLGGRTPAPEVERVLAEGGVGLVALAASEAQADQPTLERVVRRVGRACELAGAELVIGGEGAWPSPLPHGTRLHSFTAFVDHLEALESAS